MGCMERVKRALPKTAGDIAAFGFMFVMIHFIGFFELLVVLPVIYEHHQGYREYWGHVFSGWFIYFQVMCSLWKTMSVDITSGSLVLPSVLRPGWKFCAVCEHNAPPRSFHCFVCRKCVLRRDHHCVFTGNCVGHTNIRHFITLLLYLSIASCYCNYLNIDYTWDVLGGLTWRSVFTMIVPLVSWALGVTETFTFGVAFISATSIFGFLLIAAFTVYHAMNLYLGQTTYEKTHDLRDYDLGWKENVRQVYGINWRYAWLSSFIPSPLPCNGIDYPKRLKYENVKDM